MEENGIWNINYKIPAYEVDATRRATLVTIGNLFQDIAGKHAHHHKMGYYDMQERGQFWALSRLKIAIHIAPMWQQDIQIQTWISSMKGPFSNRHFQILDREGKILCEGSTLWVLLDINTRKPVRIGAMTMPFLEDKIPACGLAEKVRPQKDPPLIHSHKVVYSDLDMVGHVNNVKYIEWITDSLQIDRSQWQAKMLSINFLSETHLGDTIAITSLSQNDTGHYFELKKNGSNDVVCRAIVQGQ